MGFGTIAGNIVMFIAVLLLATGTMAVFKMNIERSMGAMKEQSDQLSDQMKTSIHINSVVYHNSTNRIEISIINDGQMVLDPNYIDIYVDGAFVPRDVANRTLDIDDSTYIKNANLFDHSEILNIVVKNQNLDENINHYIRITTQYSFMEESNIDMQV